MNDLSELEAKIIKVSILICTRNRFVILKECLRSILPQIENRSDCELLVIDNASSDNTSEEVTKWFKGKKKLRYFFEPMPGLSFARNTGAIKAKGDWLLYLDDDAKASENLVSRMFFGIENFQFDAYGGAAFPWYKYGCPRWMPTDFAIVKQSENTSKLDSGTYFSGMIMILKKRIVIELGGFATNLGMSNSIGYGEETQLQIRMRERGFIIGFDPHLVVYHCVLPHKLELMWHLKNFFAKGRDGQLVKKDKRSLEILANFSRTLCTLFLIHLPTKSWKVVTNKHYYIQNAILDSCGPFLTWAGRMNVVLKKNKNIDGNFCDNSSV